MTSFKTKYTFKNVLEMKENELMHSNEEVHSSVPWSVSIKKQLGHLTIHWNCHKPMAAEKWSCKFNLWIKLSAGNRTTSNQYYCVKLSNRPEINKNFAICSPFIDWNSMLRDFVIDGCLTVKVIMWNLKLEGFQRIPLRNFDKATSKEYSDTTLIVKGKKFYVSKLFLSTQSIHFKHLLMEEETNSPTFTEASSLTQRLLNKTRHASTQFMDQFKQPGRTVVSLEDVDPDDFQVFLEVIYGEPALDDDTVNQVLKMARMYNTDTIISRCEEFLIEKSAKRAGLKFDIALNFGLESLKKHCIANFKSLKDVRAAIPSDLSRIDRPLLEEMFQKNLSF